MPREVRPRRRGLRDSSDRGLSPWSAAAALILVVGLVGAGSYVVFARIGPENARRSECFPPASPGCAAGGGHGLTVLDPFATAQTGLPIPFSVLLPAGTAATGYSFNFGDGTPWVASTQSTVDHAYANPGTYLVQANATVGGTVEDNLQDLTLLTIEGGEAASTLSGGGAPVLTGQILANSSSVVSPSGVLRAGDSLTVQGSYVDQPTNPGFRPQPPTVEVSPGAGTPLVTTATNQSIAASVSFAAPGTYTVTVVGSATGTGPYLGETASARYVATVVVPPSGVAGNLRSTASVPDPHPGTILYYSGATGGARTLDPAQAYDGASYEPILSVYEALLMYNGSVTGPEPSDFLPVLASCVPGPSSSSCEALYGSTLYNASEGAYTFPLAPGARFFDPSTRQGWPVYPTDVLFSLARTMSFADLPQKGANNGWILSQALLPGPSSGTAAANASWDSGLHFPYNNTPANIFASMSVNGSSCPLAAMTNGNPGCITFFARGNGQPWPYFLELLADQEGGSVASCGWESSTASTGGQAGLPGWTAGGPTSDPGDHPCLLPGGATSSTSPAYLAAVQAIGPTAWDQYQYVGTTQGIGHVYKEMVGSGPFYLPTNGYLPGISYMLRASPVYAPNPGCTWSGCMPPRGHTAQTVEVTWETDAAQGEQALASGVADFAAIPSTDAPLALQLIEQGKLSALEFPTLTIYTFNFNMNFNLAAAQTLTPDPITVAPDWFAYLGMRQFFATAYPYTTIEKTVLSADGFTAGFPYGGAIPEFMANYYPSNITWPYQDPSQSCAGAGATTSLCPTWWWDQITNASSPYYDPEVAACSVARPCQLPIMGVNGFPQQDEEVALWQQSLAALSGNRLTVSATDLNYLTLDLNEVYAAAGGNALPVYNSAWSPDYPDPTDYVGPLYTPNSTFTYPDSVAQELGRFAGASCPSGYAYYAALPLPVGQSCEGAAYRAMTEALQAAAEAPAGSGRVALYNLAERIAQQLALYVYQYQADATFTSAPWINLNSIDTNVTTGGGGDLVWWTIGGNGVWGP